MESIITTLNKVTPAILYLHQEAAYIMTVKL